MQKSSGPRDIGKTGGTTSIIIRANIYWGLKHY